MRKSPLIVELAGPSGAGKSTLNATLPQRSAKTHPGVLPDVRAAKDLPFFAWNAFLLIPTFLDLYLHKTDRFLTPQEMAYLAILKGWHQRVKRSAGAGEVVILDQGPVYILGELLRFGPETLTGPSGQKWWESTCQQWAETLDMVICLDTADEKLVERVRSRAQEHGVKANSDQWAREFLARCRAAQEKVLSAMTRSAQSPKVLRFDTSKMSLDETLAKILALF